ncbi:hypothetical protein EDD17DRAFT_1511088 [Pisolithus thermaeus]|nr:hypothetical protein EDD17DRAFT_1511088 [Pisolithus thermaeus]
MSDSLVFGVKCTCVALAFLWFVARKRNPLPYPPGPKGFPIIGNAFDINLKTPQFTYAKQGTIFEQIPRSVSSCIASYDEITTSTGALSGLGTYMMLSRGAKLKPNMDERCTRIRAVNALAQFRTEKYDDDINTFLDSA